MNSMSNQIKSNDEIFERIQAECETIDRLQSATEILIIDFK
jgi:hypothetical protein